jgi:CheY-like chemotaxis protein
MQTILMIEDEVATREALIELLEKMNATLWQ